MTTKKIDFDLFKEWVALLSQHGVGMITMMEIDAAIERLEFQHKQSEKKKEYDLYERGDNGDGVLWCRTLENSCREFHKSKTEKYPPEMYREFITYWSEPNGKGHPRWWSTKNQKNGRWHLPGRLATWFKNYKPTKAVQASNPTLPEHLRMRKLT